MNTSDLIEKIEEILNILIDKHGGPVGYGRWKKEAIQALLTLISESNVEARLQELNNYLNDSVAHPPSYTRKRIAKLKSQLTSGEK